MLNSLFSLRCHRPEDFLLPKSPRLPRQSPFRGQALQGADAADGATAGATPGAGAVAGDDSFKKNTKYQLYPLVI